jgi:VanZ family protein
LKPSPAFRLWLPPALYCLLIFFLSHMSHPPIPPGLSGDILHYPEYGVLAWLLARALQGGRGGRASLPILLGACALAVVIGALDEVHQAFVPERLPDIVDWYHDAVGASAGAAAWGVWRWFRR